MMNTVEAQHLEEHSGVAHKLKLWMFFAGLLLFGGLISACWILADRVTIQNKYQSPVVGACTIAGALAARRMILKALPPRVAKACRMHACARIFYTSVTRCSRLRPRHHHAGVLSRAQHEKRRLRRLLRSTVIVKSNTKLISNIPLLARRVGTSDLMRCSFPFVTT